MDLTSKGRTIVYVVHHRCRTRFLAAVQSAVCLANVALNSCVRPSLEGARVYAGCSSSVCC